MKHENNPNRPTEVTPREARGAKPVKGMPFVLGLSILAVIMTFIVVFGMFM